MLTEISGGCLGQGWVQGLTVNGHKGSCWGGKMFLKLYYDDGCMTR